MYLLHLFNNYAVFCFVLFFSQQKHEQNKEVLRARLENREKEKFEESKKLSSKSLPHSNHILEQANSRIIDEMYRLLVTAQKERDDSSKFIMSVGYYYLHCHYR